MDRVNGIGGIFFKANNVMQLKEWYKDHLGISYNDEDGGASFYWRDDKNPARRGFTVRSIFPKDTKYFDPSSAPFMMNFRVANLDSLVKQLQTEGIMLVGGIEEHDCGRFAWSWTRKETGLSCGSRPRNETEGCKTQHAPRG